MQGLSQSRTPHGVRGLKFVVGNAGTGGMGRTPHGVRGLKSPARPAAAWHLRVAPHTGCVD